jgi:hypothetical protein
LSTNTAIIRNKKSPGLTRSLSCLVRRARQEDADLSAAALIAGLVVVSGRIVLIKLLVPDMAEYMRRRIELLAKTEAEHFSRDISLEKMEINAEKKLIQLREKMLSEDPSLVTGLYYDKYQKLIASPLYEAIV